MKKPVAGTYITPVTTNDSNKCYTMIPAILQGQQCFALPTSDVTWLMTTVPTHT